MWQLPECCMLGKHVQRDTFKGLPGRIVPGPSSGASSARGTVMCDGNGPRPPAWPALIGMLIALRHHALARCLPLALLGPPGDDARAVAAVTPAAQVRSHSRRSRRSDRWFINAPPRLPKKPAIAAIPTQHAGQNAVANVTMDAPCPRVKEAEDDNFHGPAWERVTSGFLVLKRVGTKKATPGVGGGCCVRHPGDRCRQAVRFRRLRRTA